MELPMLTLFTYAFISSCVADTCSQIRSKCALFKTQFISLELTVYKASTIVQPEIGKANGFVCNAKYQKAQCCSISVQCPEKVINEGHVRSNLNTLITLAISNLHLQAEKEPFQRLAAVAMKVPRIIYQSLNLEPKRFIATSRVQIDVFILFIRVKRRSRLRDLYR